MPPSAACPGGREREVERRWEGDDEEVGYRLDRLDRFTRHISLDKWEEVTVPTLTIILTLTLTLP